MKLLHYRENINIDMIKFKSFIVNEMNSRFIYQLESQSYLNSLTLEFNI